MVKITRPKSLFGKQPYYKEQLGMVAVADFITRGALIIDPYIAGFYAPVEILGIKRRKKLAKKWMGHAKKVLSKIM